MSGANEVQTLSQQQTETPIDSLASTGQVQQAIMGIALGRIGTPLPPSLPASFGHAVKGLE
jgi:hypothetical protein